MPIADKLYDIQAESEELEEKKLATIIAKSHQFREEQHATNEKQAKTVVKMEKSSKVQKFLPLDFHDQKFNE